MSGINILRRLLLKEAVKGSGQASGIMSIGDSVRKLADKKLQSYLLAAQKQGVDLDKLGEQEIKYMLELNKKPNYRVISQGDPEFVSFRDQILGKKNRDNVIQGKFGKPFGETITDDIIRDINNMETIPSMKEMNKVIKREGRYKNLTDKDVDKIFKATEDRTSGRLDDIDPEDMYADGGVAGLLGERPGYDEGKEVINYDNDANYRGWKKLYEVNPDIAAMNKNHSKYEQYYKSKQNSKALGGRVPFAMGKRAFLKLMGSVGAGIAGLKTGIGLGGKKAATEVAKDVATTSATTPPSYFFNLVKKIKNLGDDVTPNYAIQERQKVTKYKDYELTEDLTTGEKTIQRNINADPDVDGPPNMVEETYMNYKPGKGQMDETTKGKTPPDEYTEDTSYIRNDRENTGEIYSSVDGVGDDVIEEGTIFEDNIADFTTKKLRKKKASGGLAYMVGE